MLCSGITTNLVAIPLLHHVHYLSGSPSTEVEYQYVLLARASLLVQTVDIGDHLMQNILDRDCNIGP